MYNFFLPAVCNTSRPRAHARGGHHLAGNDKRPEVMTRRGGGGGAGGQGSLRGEGGGDWGAGRLGGRLNV